MKKAKKQETFLFNYWRDYWQNTGSKSWLSLLGKPPLEEPISMKVARGYTQAVRAQEYSPENLLIHLSNQLKQIDQIRDRENTLFGRIYNKMAGDNPRIVTLDGTVIQQLYDTAEQTPPIIIERQKLYEIDHAELRELYKQASKVISPIS
ncbi:hypothetical protein WH95_01345 [Kiloniella litopenaei]|uniref:Uncharacterized protein n=1 Tax=Kiloniella litopenaei TaxID=1549748 RepID=A0A0M2RGQ8_9PROT|nr:hypothetical protein [Kiloniella litopenaei]KKJ78748.1 hypothetical protein WH95_01345 [Kiloniella litopenaei]